MYVAIDFLRQPLFPSKELIVIHKYVPKAISFTAESLTDLTLKKLPKDDKIYQMDIAFLKQLYDVPNGNKIHMPVLSIPRPLGFLVWYENMPSVNTGSWTSFVHT
jgi:hypothetical protein